MQCCNKQMKQLKKINLLPSGIYSNRVLIVYQCANCGCLKYSLSEFNEITGQVILDRNKPNRVKNIKAWLKALEKQKSYFPDEVLKVGNKSNMAFIYGQTLKKKKDFIHIGYDFNGTKRKIFSPLMLSS